MSFRTLSSTCALVPRRCQQTINPARRVARSFQTARQLKPCRSVNVNNHRVRTLTNSAPKTTLDYAARPKGPLAEPAVTVTEGALRVGDIHVPNIWLRDNCPCSECVHQDTQQRLPDTFKIPANIQIKSSEKLRGQTKIEWTDGHQSTYSHEMLNAAVLPLEQRAVIRQGLVKPILWGSDIANEPPTVRYNGSSTIEEDYTKLTDAEKRELFQVLDNIRTYGFTFISNLPATPEASESILRRIGPIRETHYGGFYDFTADLASKDTAYTNIALEAHTDTTYFSDPAGLQAFHLLSHTHGSGGASLLVDGFKVAKDLWKQDREAYKILSEVNVHAHASGNEGISIMPDQGYPVLSHDRVTGHLSQVRWNSSDRAGLELPISESAKWYEAARKFDALLKKKENEYWEQLQPGTMVIFDNWRVLHGRSEFTGKRRICGAYVSRDDWISRFKVLKWGEATVRGVLGAS